MKTKQIRDVSYIISSYSWIDQLPTLLYSLRAQTHRDFEALVTDNSTSLKAIAETKEIVCNMKDERFRYLHTAPLIPVADCFWSSEVGVKRTSGRWLCFCAEDCYYPPQWAQRMLTCAYRDNLDLVLCGRSETGPDTCGIDRYEPLVLGTAAFPGYKPSFLMKRDKFHGWLNKPTMGACSGVDKTTLQYMLRNPAVRWGVERTCFYVHN